MDVKLWAKFKAVAGNVFGSCIFAANLQMLLFNIKNSDRCEDMDVRETTVTFAKRILCRDIDSERLWRYREKAINSRSKLVRNINKSRYYRLMHSYNASIPLAASFAGRPQFPHKVYGIFISVGAKIGKNCVIFHQVTVGSNTLADSKGKGAPQIGDNVYIGCGAKIIGNVKIGNNVRIGANCVVTKDVPDNCTIVAAQPRLIMHDEERDNNFIGFNAIK